MALVLFALSRSASADSAAELVAQGERNEATGDSDRAVRNYSDAIALDRSREVAYIHLAELRMKKADFREAIAVCTVGLEHAPRSLPLLKARAKARQDLGDLEGAQADLETALKLREDEGVLVLLADVLRKQKRPLQELEVWRRLRTQCQFKVLELHQPVEATASCSKARTMVRVLTLIAHPLDPVTAPPATVSGVRKSLAALDRQQ
jgi:tetratricopeptide (TPR) repeat protein